MAYLSIVVIIFVGCFLTPVVSQQDIVSVKTIEDGSPFTISCSVQQVTTPSSANVTSISNLQIHVMSNGTKNYTLVAQYLTLAPLNLGKEFQAPPTGRNWMFNFSGSNSENGGVNNSRGMQIEILVSDGKREDAGVYKCTLIYYGSTGISTTVFREQNVSSTASSREDIVSVKTIEDGNPFTITCNAQRVITSSANLTSIASLQIHVLNNGAKDYILVAQYLTSAPPNIHKELQAPPTGRNWMFNFSGSNSNIGGVKNRGTMKIEILVSDSKREDAGVYKCTLIYYGSIGIVTTVFREQNVSSTVVSQQDIISVNAIQDWIPFTIACNAQLVISSSANLTSIASLQIHVLNNGAKDYSLVAQYLTFAPCNVNKELQAPPTGRNWEFSFSGSNSVNGGTNNQASMGMEILVSDGTREDAGLYRCTVVYYSTVGISTTVSREQNISYVVASQQDIVSVKTIVAGSPFTVTCGADRLVNYTERISSIERLHMSFFENDAYEFLETVYYASGSHDQGSSSLRNWVINFSGASANKQSGMKIEILVDAARCEDAGLYECMMFYNNGRVAYRKENVTSTACIEH